MWEYEGNGMTDDYLERLERLRECIPRVGEFIRTRYRHRELVEFYEEDTYDGRIWLKTMCSCELRFRFTGAMLGNTQQYLTLQVIDRMGFGKILLHCGAELWESSMARHKIDTNYLCQHLLVMG